MCPMSLLQNSIETAICVRHDFSLAASANRINVSFSPCGMLLWAEAPYVLRRHPQFLQIISSILLAFKQAPIQDGTRRS